MAVALPSPPQQQSGWARHSSAFILTLLLLTLCWCAAFAFSLWRSRSDTLANGAVTADVMVRGIEEHLTQSLRMLDLLASSTDPHQPWASGQQALVQRLATAISTAPYLRSVSVLDPTGRLVASSNPDNLGVLLDARIFYPDAQPGADILRVGLPWRGRDLADGSPISTAHPIPSDEASFVPVLRRLPGSGPAHWLVAVLNPDYFIHHAAQLIPEERGATQWLRHDGVLLFSTRIEDVPGTLDAAGAWLAQLQHHNQGVLTQQLPSDREVITSYRASAHFPTVAVVHLDRTHLLAGWWQQARRIAFILLPVLAALSIAVTWAWRKRRALMQRQQAQEDEHRLMASVFQISRDAIYITDGQGKVLSVNAAFETLTGYTAQDVLGIPPLMLFANSVPRNMLDDVGRTVIIQGHWRGEIHCQTKTGCPYTALLTVEAVHGLDGRVHHTTCTLVDVTQERQAEQRLQLAASVFSHAREGIMITDPQGILIDVNSAFTHITGYTRDEVLGKSTRLLNSGRQGKEFYVSLWNDLKTQGHWAGEMWNRRKSGEVYAQVATISSVCDAEGHVMRYVALFSDVSQQKETELRLQHVAHFDALTGLPNRALLSDRLRQAMVQTLRRGGKLAVVFLDLDGFKAVNDTHGHNVGDKLLIALATRMKQALRDGDTLARIGGDEFVALLLDLPDHESCTPVLDRLRMAAAQPLIIEAKTLQVSGSLGVVFYPQSEPVEADQLLRQADQAMYQAKLAGKNRFHVFDAEQDRDIRGRNANLEEIRQAMDAQQFRLHYQPKVNMRTGQVLGAEALIRWEHPEHGVLPPARFLPALDNHPLSLELGYWVLETALTQIEAWRATGHHIPVSVNVDAQQLQQKDFVDALRALLTRHPTVRPGDLTLEVLETSALNDMDRVASIIEACRALGVTFALDDFGTGYSSLSYLRHLPTRQLKIDQSFVRDMLDDPDDLAILDGVIGLAVAFRREVIAEGVETIDHGQLLLRLGCDWAQGYAIAKPMPAGVFTSWMKTWHPPESWLQTPRTKREDLPLLFAAVEHRAWIAAVVGHLLGQRERPPALDPHECRLGHWIEHEGGRARHGVKLQFNALETLHLDIHRMAREMINAFPAKSKNTEWLELSTQQLHQARDALLERLETLQ